VVAGPGLAPQQLLQQQLAERARGAGPVQLHLLGQLGWALPLLLPQQREHRPLAPRDAVAALAQAHHGGATHRQQAAEAKQQHVVDGLGLAQAGARCSS
jgi:hypothetical protein